MIKLIANWLEDHQIKFCALCRKFIFHKDAHYEGVGISVPLCTRCHNETFHPFTTKGR